MTRKIGGILGGGHRLRKICVVITNRAPYGRLKSVMKAIQEHPHLELQVIKAASAYELPIDFKADAEIQCLIDGDNTNAMALTTGVFLTQIGGILQGLKPDIVLIHGDRFEQLGVAIAASYNNIFLAHSECGDVSSSIDDKVRNAVTQLSDLFFPVTELAKERLIRMGCDPSKVFVVGSTALDSLKGIDLSNDRTEPYIVVLHHPNTTDPEPLEPLIKALERISIHAVWVNPNVDAGNKAMLKLIHEQKAEFVKNLPPEEYARLIYNARCLVGNSSSFIKEAGFLGVPAVLVGNRQRGRELGFNVFLALNNNANEIYNSIILAQRAFRRIPPDYRFGDGAAAQKIVQILSEVDL